MQERDSGQGERPESGGREYGESDEYAKQGTLNEGYGQSEKMAEDQWSGERYHQQAERVDHETLDENEPREGDASDIDRMAGGMTGVEQPSDVMSGTSERQEDTDVMSDRPERDQQLDDLQG